MLALAMQPGGKYQQSDLLQEGNGPNCGSQATSHLPGSQNGITQVASGYVGYAG